MDNTTLITWTQITDNTLLETTTNAYADIDETNRVTIMADGSDPEASEQVQLSEAGAIALRDFLNRQFPA